MRPHRNVTGYPLEIRDFNNFRVGPGEVIDLDDLGHDPGEHGVITGLVPVDDEPGDEQGQDAPAVSVGRAAKTTKPAAKANGDTGKEQNQ